MSINNLEIVSNLFKLCETVNDSLQLKLATGIIESIATYFLC